MCSVRSAMAAWWSAVVAQSVADADVDGLHGVGGAFQGGVVAGEVGE